MVAVEVICKALTLIGVAPVQVNALSLPEIGRRVPTVLIGEF